MNMHQLICLEAPAKVQPMEPELGEQPETWKSLGHVVLASRRVRMCGSSFMDSAHDSPSRLGS